MKIKNLSPFLVILAAPILVNLGFQLKPHLNIQMHSIPYLDKLFHMMAYSVFTCFILFIRKDKTLWISLLFLFSIGFLDEISQAIFAFRSFDWMDMLSNFIGIGLGYFIFHQHYARLKKIYFLALYFKVLLLKKLNIKF